MLLLLAGNCLPYHQPKFLITKDSKKALGLSRFPLTLPGWYYIVLLRTTKYYSSTNPYCKVLLQYYKVLQSTTPVLVGTTKYYASTTLYCKVLLHTTPVLQSTTPYYQVLRQHYSTVCARSDPPKRSKICARSDPKNAP